MNCMKNSSGLVFTKVCKSFLRRQKSTSSIVKDSKDLKSSYDAIIIGAGHNGLISAAYLQKAGYSVCVLERRNVIGGAAVTEEIVPGFKFSRASYLLSLLRPFIIDDLKLKDHGLKFHIREPFNSYTPIKQSLWPQFKAKSLLLGSDLKLTLEEISKFSLKDAKAYEKYEKEMGRFVQAVVALLDNRPPNLAALEGASWITKLKSLSPLWKAAKAIGIKDVPRFHEIMTASASKILDQWFESEPLKATLATDALIGTMSGPHSAGTGYVLLHHIMGGVDGKPGAWAYPEGGMGAVSTAIGSSAAKLGVHIFTDHEVETIEYKTGSSKGNAKATGVVLKNGQVIKANKAVLSNATPEVTFNKLTPKDNAATLFGHDFINAVNRIDYTSPVTKINVALSRLPSFTADPNPTPNAVHHQHKCTIHLNCESISNLEDSYVQCQRSSVPSDRPMIELVIPSSLDPTLAPQGAHVCLLFTQYTPISPSNGSWADPVFKEKYATSVFNVVEEYAPGFKESIVGKEVLTPWDLEQTFGLTGGNIFHGAMSVDQLYWLRPIFSEKCWFPETPVQGLYLCGSGTHPGGGVMGLPGYLAAKALLSSSKSA